MKSTQDETWRAFISMYLLRPSIYFLSLQFCKYIWSVQLLNLCMYVSLHSCPNTSWIKKCPLVVEHKSVCIHLFRTCIVYFISVHYNLSKHVYIFYVWGYGMTGTFWIWLSCLVAALWFFTFICTAVIVFDVNSLAAWSIWYMD